MFKCTSCNGNLRFDITTQKIKCDYCENLFDPYEITSLPVTGKEEQVFDTTCFSCPQCGGEIYSTDETAAGFCSFCGSSVILNSRIQKLEYPKHIIPFSITKEECKRIYHNQTQYAIFAPKELKNPDYIDGFRGIYMPYWLYSFRHHGHITLKASQSPYEQAEYNISRYNINTDLNASYEGLSHDATTVFDDELSNSISPYNTQNLQKFSPAFLSGFYANTADKKSEYFRNDLAEFVKEYTTERVMTSQELEHYNLDSAKYHIDKQTVCECTSEHLAMFPVWFLSYRNKNRVSYATINGQTGKFSAELPVDPKKYLLGSLLLAIPFFLILTLLLTLRPSVMLGISILFSAFATFIYHKEYISIPTTKNPSQLTKVMEISGYALNIIGIISAIIIFMINPIFDSYYYGCILFMIVSIALTILLLIHYHNLHLSRPLPHFRHLGGDNNA